MGLSPKRWMVISTFLGIFFTTISWHLSDTGLVSTTSFMDKLFVSIGTWVALQIAIYVLLGRKEAKQ